MHFTYEICTDFYVLLEATRHWNFQRLFTTARRHCSVLQIEKECHKIDFFKFHIQTRSAQQQWNVCHHKMVESSSIEPIMFR